MKMHVNKLKAVLQYLCQIMSFLYRTVRLWQLHRSRLKRAPKQKACQLGGRHVWTEQGSEVSRQHTTLQFKTKTSPQGQLPQRRS